MPCKTATYLYFALCVALLITWAVYHNSPGSRIATKKAISAVQQHLPSSPSRPHSQAHEDRLRHLRDDVTDWWRYMTSRVEKDMNMSASNEALVKGLNETLRNTREYYQTIMKDVWAISGRGDDWKRAENEKLSSLIQSRIHKVQNPPDCSKARKLVCEMAELYRTGFGACVHHVSMCLRFAYITGRTLIVQETGEWRYLPEGLTSAFLPVSDTCTTSDGTYVFWGDHTPETPTVRLRNIDYMRDKLPDRFLLSIPREIAERVASFHSNPPLWFNAQFVKYTMRMVPEVLKYIKKMAALVKFRHPIVGIHVRRTDKTSEAKMYPLEEYMRRVEDHFGVMATSRNLTERLVFLATDTRAMQQEAVSKYPEYTWLYNKAGVETALSRHGLGTTKDVLLDMVMLSMCDHVVCTLSSNMCLLAMELKQLHGEDTTNNFESLDWPYHFNKQLPACVVWKAHARRDRSEIDISVGDVITDSRNEWDGFSKGRNQRTKKYGRYPTFKARPTLKILDFGQTIV